MERDNFMEKLKRCPFCGGEAELHHGITGVLQASSSFIRCEKCFCQTDIFVINTKYSCDEKAIEAWNKRVKDDEAKIAYEYYCKKNERRNNENF